MSKKWYIGTSDSGREYLSDFSWDCGWYWSGGYLGNRNLHHHFKGLNEGRNQNMFDAFKRYFKTSVFDDNESALWRLCDLMKQFYSYRDAAECFLHGGHYTSEGRTDAELQPMAATVINSHIEDVIIPEVRKLMNEVSK